MEKLENIENNSLSKIFSTFNSTFQIPDEICNLQAKLISTDCDNTKCYQSENISSNKLHFYGNDIPGSSDRSLPEFLLSFMSPSNSVQGAITPDTCIEKLLQVFHVSLPQKRSRAGVSVTDQQRIKSAVIWLKSLKVQQPAVWLDIAGKLFHEKLPLEVFWHLHDSDILPLSDYLASLLGDREGSTHLGEQLVNMSCQPSEFSLCRRILSVILGFLVKTAFPVKKSEDIVQRKTCIEVLDRLLRGLVDHIYIYANGSQSIIVELGNQEMDVSPVSWKKFSSHTLSLILCHKADVKVSEALRSQATWTSAKVPSDMKVMFKQLLVGFTSKEVIELVGRVLEREEVNWRILLSCLSTFLVVFSDAGSSLRDHILVLLTEGLENADMESTIAAFLLARQSCAEGEHVFPSYGAWLQETFGENEKNPASSRKSFTFLTKFLTELVPFEPADILKAHVLRPPFIPSKCRQLWNDYIQLAKTRLNDLKVTLAENVAVHNHGSNVHNPNACLEDVNRVIKAFESSGALPISVLEYSIFRRPYFVGTFLRTLLTPRHLPDVADGKMKFIESLWQAGKIPSSMYKKYQEASCAEKEKLLEGVFEWDKDHDDEQEMVMEPLDALKHRLAILSAAVFDKSSNVREMVSSLSEKLSAILGYSPHDVFPMAGDCITITIGVCDITSPLYQSACTLFDFICSTANSCSYNDQTEFDWLRLLVQMLARHLTLFPILLERVVEELSNEGALLSSQKTKGIAAFIFHYCCNLALFPSFNFTATCTHAARERRQCGEHISSQERSSRGGELRCHDVAGAPAVNCDTDFMTLSLRCLGYSTESQASASLRILMGVIRSATLADDVSMGPDRSGICLLSAFLSQFVFTVWRHIPQSRPGTLSTLNSPHSGAASSPGGSSHDDTDAGCLMLFASRAVQKSLLLQPVSLSDWLNFELFSPCGIMHLLDRQNYLMLIFSHFSLETGLLHTCSVLVSMLLSSSGLLSERQTTVPEVSSCCRLRHLVISGADPSPVSVMELMSLLSTVLESVGIDGANIQPEGESCDIPWLIQRVQSASPLATLRIIMGCPPRLLFVGGVSCPPTKSTVDCTLKFFKHVLMRCCSHGGVVSFSLLCHMLKGYCEVRTLCANVFVMKVFEEDPAIILSIMVHWDRLCAILPSLCRSTCSLWAKIPDMLAASNKCYDSCHWSFPVVFHPMLAAVAIYVAYSQRGWPEYSQLKSGFLHCLHQKHAQVLELFSELLLISLSVDHQDYDRSREKVRVDWLLGIWQACPRTFRLAVTEQSECVVLRKELLPESCLSCVQFTVLRLFQDLPARVIATEDDCVKGVVALTASVCRTFDQGRWSGGTVNLDLLVHASQQVVDILNITPRQQLAGISQEDIKGCGLKAYNAYRQRLRG